jgi:glycosyltransferase involved in cell wall biosynthesis
MRVLIVAHSFPRYAGDPAGTFLLSLAQGQLALGHEVTVVAPHAPRTAEAEVLQGVRVVRYRYGSDAAETLAYAGTMADQVMRSWSSRWRLLRLMAASRSSLRKVIRSEVPDVIHVHWWFPGALAVWPRLGMKIPVVITSHGTDLFLLDRAPAVRRLARPLFRAAAQVTVISTPLIRRVEALGVARDRLTVVPMPMTRERAPVAESCSPDRGRLLFVGRLVERKGCEYAIRAVAALRDGGRDTTLVVVGDGPERERLEALVAELSLQQHVEFAGVLASDAVGDRYSAAGALLMPAVTDWKGEQEGFGMVIVEAMRHGLPVIASASGGIVDIIRDGENGLLVPERDPVAIAAAVIRLLEEPGLADRLGDAAREDVELRFSPARIAGIFDSVYRRAIGAAG